MRYCAFETYRQTLETPAEFCEDEALEGSEFCDFHQPYEPEDDPFTWSLEDQELDLDWWDEAPSEPCS